MKKNIYFFLAFLLIANISFSQTIDDLTNKVEELKNNKALSHGIWSVYAEYADNGENLIAYNEENSLAPASGLKVFTSSTALNLLGEDYRYKTKLYYDGSIDGNILYGNIYIVGGGDPTLGSDLVKGSVPLDTLMMIWKNSIEKLGIKKVNGAVIGDDFLFNRITVPDYWPWIDIGNYYGAGPNALTIHDNLYRLFFHPGMQEGEKAEVVRTEPEIFGLNFINYMKTGAEGSGDNGYIYCAPKQFTATLRGTVPAGVNEFSIKGSIPNPPLFAAQYLEKYLIKSGIEVTDSAKVLENKKDYNQEKLIIQTVSPPLKDIVYIVNKRSNNLYTEHLLRTIAVEKGAVGSEEEGIKVLTSFLKENNIPTDGFKLLRRLRPFKDQQNNNKNNGKTSFFYD